MQQINPNDLHEMLNASDTPPLLLDVREPAEFAHCHIANSQLMPMQTVPQNLEQLPRDKTIVTICHHGMRSMQVAQFLAQQGFNNIVNLAGGVDAWALQVEPDMPRY